MKRSLGISMLVLGESSQSSSVSGIWTLHLLWRLSSSCLKQVGSLWKEIINRLHINSRGLEPVKYSPPCPMKMMHNFHLPIIISPNVTCLSSAALSTNNG